ncbi:DUF5063 domain-containing protein [Siminovitchia terrae]|uniref:DUF5063 domain-containing protein n=1 Tax=Siminovitchia terrae TaxID=1914933 RepID=UPI0035E41520
MYFEQYEYYWEIFNPYNFEAPVCTSLTDDVLDMYKDVKKGIFLFERKKQKEAFWNWKFHFKTHWGGHAVDAIRALHSANLTPYLK